MTSGPVPKIKLPDVPSPKNRVKFKSEFGTRFILTVDTEEEFDWTKPFERSGHSVDTVPALAKFQEFCEKFEIKPVYLVDFPIVESELACDLLRQFVEMGRADIGVQLHPWVNPPFEENINNFNSYAGNLPKELEDGKFNNLRNAITTRIGVSPIIYRAGRYGVGQNSAEILAASKIRIDSSVRSNFDYRGADGPNFFRCPLEPYWLDKDAGLIELPLTTVFAGVFRRFARIIYPIAEQIRTLRGVLSRLGLIERIALTPEGITAQEAIRGIDIALADGVPILNFSLHSPSLAPGHTPYVKTDDDLDALYDWFRAVFSHLESKNVTPAALDEIIEAIED